MAAGLGLEPRLSDPESPVLPLHHPAVCSLLNYSHIQHPVKLKPASDPVRRCFDQVITHHIGLSGPGTAGSHKLTG